MKEFVILNISVTVKSLQDKQMKHIHIPSGASKLYKISKNLFYKINWRHLWTKEMGSERKPGRITESRAFITQLVPKSCLSDN